MPFEQTHVVEARRRFVQESLPERGELLGDLP